MAMPKVIKTEKTKKALGSFKEQQIRESQIKIINALFDGKEHTYSELLKLTTLTSTTLTSHLRKLSNFISKRIDTQSGAYPYPVFYKIDDTHEPLLNFASLLDQGHKRLLNELSKAKDKEQGLDLISDFYRDALDHTSTFVNSQKFSSIYLNISLDILNYTIRSLSNLYVTTRFNECKK